MVKSYEKNSGNILFLILIAVTLFAGLSVVVFRSERGSGDVSKEREKLDKAKTENFVTAVNTGILRLQMKGCATIDYTAPQDLVPGDMKCALFHPDGGAVIWQNVDECEWKETPSDIPAPSAVWLLNEAWYDVSPAEACGGCASLSPTTCNIGDVVTVSVGIHNCQDHPNIDFPGQWYIANHWCSGDMKIYCHGPYAPCGGDRGDSQRACPKRCI